MRQKEGLLDDRIGKYCKENNIWSMKTSGNGIPDIIICVNGLFVGMETKVGNNKLSPLQQWQIRMIKKAKGDVHEVRSYKQAVEILEGLMINGIISLPK